MKRKKSPYKVGTGNKWDINWTKIGWPKVIGIDYNTVAPYYNLISK